MYSLGFLGAGQMGSTILGGLRERTNDTECLFFDASAARAKEVTEKYGVKAEINIEELMVKSDDLVIAVKPQVYPSVASVIAANYRSEQILISIMAGVTLATLGEGLPKTAKLVRLMPNMAMGAGVGVCLLCANENVTAAEREALKARLSRLGLVKELPEKLMNAGTAMSGSGPAFYYAMVEAMMLGGIRVGFSKDDAKELAVQSMLGAATLLQESGESAGTLRDQMLSAGGTTIAGMQVLERSGFRSGVIDAVEASYRRGEEMGKGDNKL